MNILELAILKKMVGGGGGSGTDNYNDLSNLPQINGETLAGNKTAENLGLQDALFFDSAPTEDSTNPVESGGVYNALAGKQDNLTFDDVPTEDSTNPVKSGGVYSALAGKQDNLTFDGVYNASTNKAATESTVTNAIAGLGVSAFSLDAGETIKSISETDGKVSVVKQDIAIASSQVVAMTGYTKPSSAPATPAIQQGDTANAAIGKLEFKADTNQSNILYGLNRVGKNISPISDGDNSSSTDGVMRIPINLKNGDVVRVSVGNLTVSGTSDTTSRVAFMVGTDTVVSNVDYFAHGSADDGEFTLTANCDSLWIYTGKVHSNTGTVAVSNLMICYKNIADTIGTAFEPPALPNYDLTRLEAEDRASLAEVVDSGAKNLLQLPSDSATSCGITFSCDPSTGIVTANGTKQAGDCFMLLATISLASFPRKFVAYCNSTENTKLCITIVPHRTNGTYASTIVIGTNTTIDLTSSNFDYFLIRAASYADTGATLNNEKIYPMLCTKAAFGVSNKFVPYRPNWDLVVSEIGHYMIDDGNTNHSTTTYNCSNLANGIYLVAVNRYQNQTTAYGTALYLMTINDNILPLFTTIVETADCKATFALSNDKVLSITYPRSAYWQAYVKFI